MINDLIKILQNQSIIIDISDPDVVSKAKATHNTVTTRKDRHKDPRTDNQILRDSFMGTMREVGIARLTGGIINEQTPVWSDRSTYGWDIDTFDTKLEIKPQHGVYFAVSETVANRLVNNSDYYHYILTVNLLRLTKNDWRVIPCQLIKSIDFARNCNKSLYKKYQMYYDHRYNPTIKLNNWSK